MRRRTAIDRLARRMAVALKYEPGKDRAPKVVAKGYGLVARQIIQVAREHGVPVREDPELGALLARLDLGQEIPSELFSVVAEVLAFVYRMNYRAGKELRT